MGKSQIPSATRNVVHLCDLELKIETDPLDAYGFAFAQAPKSHTLLYTLSRAATNTHFSDAPTPTMGRNRTYGTKKSTVSASTSAIFGRSPLSDITNAFGNINIADNRIEDDNDELGLAEENSLNAVKDVNHSDPQLPKATKNQEIESNANLSIDLSNSTTLEYLRPLTKSYFKDHNVPLEVRQWAAIIDQESTVVKIAEASFAEVYRVTNDIGDSILKIIQLQVPSDPTSLESPTAIKVESTVSEVRIMNAMTEVPGFVKFKDAHIIQGKPTKTLVDSYDTYIKPKRPSLFPHPDTYTEDSTFLVLELGDAGCVLDEVGIENIDQVWDVLLGTIMALGRAEESYQFEASHQSDATC
jgi:serine/threonine-protein kinase haspin